MAHPRAAINDGCSAEIAAVGGWAYLESGSAAHESWQLVALDSSYNPVAFASSSPGTPSGWTYQSGTYTVGSGVAYVQIYSEVRSATSPTVARFDDAFVTAGTQYYHQDQLSNRLITDVNGNNIGEEGHFPFGEHLYPPLGPITDLEFTTYDRDAESGNDYAMARYYINRLGRFNSPDPLGGDIGDPQTLNRYAYVRNSPLNFTDPTGMQIDGGDDCFDDPFCGIGIGIGIGAGGSGDGGGETGGTYFPGPDTHTDPNPPAGDPDPNGPFSGPVWQEGGPQITPNLASLILPTDPGCEFGHCGGFLYGNGGGAYGPYWPIALACSNDINPLGCWAMFGPKPQTPQQRYKQCISTFNQTTAGKIVGFGSALGFVENLGEWAGLIGGKGLGVWVLDRAETAAAVNPYSLLSEKFPAPVALGGSKIVGYAGMIGTGIATAADAAARSGCSALANP